MFPGRFWMALGSGQLLNEHITGDPWIPKKESQARLLECAEIIRKLWAGERVTHRDRVRVNGAKLYARPKKTPVPIGAAASVETAEWVGSWADGLITVVKPREELAKVVAALAAGGGNGKPMFLQAQTSYAFGCHPTSSGTLTGSTRTSTSASMQSSFTRSGATRRLSCKSSASTCCRESNSSERRGRSYGTQAATRVHETNRNTPRLPRWLRRSVEHWCAHHSRSHHASILGLDAAHPSRPAL
jgi:hypothetical protein